MFNFHKPKVYRSTSGCCICKAKSSSSRFTDSAKYEDDLMECFQLAEKRTGEICNACVLLVKRWKKLPEGSNRHWRHVVDYRAGPGSKSLARSKTRNKKRPKLKAETRPASPGGDDDLSSDLSVLTVLSGPNSPLEAPKPIQKRMRDEEQGPACVDLTFWKRKKLCCGVIFVGPGNIAIVDVYNPLRCSGSCGGKKKEKSEKPPISEVAGSTPCTTISDSSSDSGYDECSNPSVVASTN